MNPFDQAWALLKESRQTELGEHYGFEDEAFSSQGPVKWYHGTTATPAESINVHGLDAKLPWGEGGKGVYVSTSPSAAQHYAETRAEERGRGFFAENNPEFAQVFGIREGASLNPGQGFVAGKPAQPATEERWGYHPGIRRSRHQRRVLLPAEPAKPATPDTRPESTWINRVRIPKDSQQELSPDRRQFREGVPRKYLVGPRPAGVRVLKMPIVPHSLEYDDEFAEAAFRDPVTNMTYPINIEAEPDRLVGRIRDETGRKAITEMRRDEEMGDWSVRGGDGSYTDKDIRHRGYMKALYEAIAGYLHANRDERFTHGDLSDDGWGMWNKIYAQQAETLPEDHPDYGIKSREEWTSPEKNYARFSMGLDGNQPYYPVRDDLERWQSDISDEW